MEFIKRLLAKAAVLVIDEIFLISVILSLFLVRDGGGVALAFLFILLGIYARASEICRELRKRNG